MIGSLGENASLRRALCLKAAGDSLHLTGYAHPSGTSRNDVLLGRFGSLVTLKRTEPKEIDIAEVGANLCQHVVGLNPRKVGSEEDRPAENAEEETCLVYQDYLLDESMTVNEVLAESGLEVVDFKRFECGEDVASGIVEKPLDAVETCQ